jgi:hypothetical protein
VTLISCQTGCHATCIFYRKKIFQSTENLKIQHKTNIDNMHQGSDPMVNTDAKKSATRGGGHYQADPCSRRTF